MTASFGQKFANVKVQPESEALASPSASVTPVYFPGPGTAGNPSCATLNALHTAGSGDTRFSHIISDNELKLDFAPPNGTFPVTNNPAPNARVVVGPEYPGHSVTIASTSSEITSWSSTMQITAVIMKMGNSAYAYPYKPFKMSDTNLRPADTFPTHSIGGLSHVTFCFGDPTTPTAGEGTISGRVVDSSGRGISRAQMVLINGATGEARITLTSPFGYYTFAGLDVNELYVVNVSHKTFAFPEKQRTIFLLGDSVADVNFIAEPRE